MAQNRAMKSGLAAEAHERIQKKFDPQLAGTMLEWVKEVTGLDINTSGESGEFHEVLKDGQVLCRLINSLQPGTIPEKKINTSQLAFKQMENINYFLEAAQKLGVTTQECFQTVDLWEQQNLAAVVTCLESLARKGSKFGQKALGPKEADPNIREWTKEQLKAGDSIISLQYGSNKGANASGINFGNTRHM
ncbi:myophilin-like [Limulus polyphemus]|uniref:Myophilin-like n=1 Tax=Limulus polyphemus TaxID=6850 RepID=A0ABM1BFP6_LIMPO|nr:myophilin-like [Limulus polyphemus]